MSTENETQVVLYSNQSILSTFEKEDYCSSISAATLLNLGYSTFLIILTLIGTAGNLAVCYAIVKSPQLRKDLINWLIASLAVSDLLTCTVHFPMKIINSLHNNMFCGGLPSCYVYIITDLCFYISSISALFFISLCRFLAITRPATYTVDISHKKVSYMIVFVWIQSAFWSSLSVFDWKTLEPSIQFTNQHCLIKNPIYYTVGYALFIFLPLLITGVMYVLALKTLKRSNSETSSGSNIDKVKHKRELRVTVTLVTVYCTFVLCWVPFCIYAVLGIWCLECFNRLRATNEDAFNGIILMFGNVLPCLFPAINPFIYAIFNPRYRAALVSIFRREYGGGRGQNIHRVLLNEIKDLHNF